MNYRHAFHAGNHGDVLKHVVLLGLLDALQQKPAPLHVLDTHAGRGLYSLAADEAVRTGEAAAGIARLPAASDNALLQRYLDAVRACRRANGATAYPGSPWLLATRLRPDDRLTCCELQPEEATALRTLFRDEPRVAVHQRDGYEAMGALLPPTPRRGLVLVDPPYEAQQAEFDAILAALRRALERWPQGVFAVWYPIKQARTLQPFVRAATALPARSAWIAELLVRADDSPLRMNGSGMLVLNAPWRSDGEIGAALRALLPRLDEGGGSAGLRWLRRPA